MGRHEFIGLPDGGMGCKYCGHSIAVLEPRRGADGKLPPCPDAPDELSGKSTRRILLLFFSASFPVTNTFPLNLIISN